MLKVIDRGLKWRDIGREIPRALDVICKIFCSSFLNRHYAAPFHCGIAIAKSDTEPFSLAGIRSLPSSTKYISQPKMAQGAGRTTQNLRISIVEQTCRLSES